MTSLPVLSEPLLETSACSRLRILNLLGEPLPGSKRFRPLPGTLERRVAPLDLVPTELSEVDTKEESHWILPEAPKRPPSQTPPSLQLEMHAILGKYMGGGRVGPVFALNNVKVPGIPDNTIPPLVVKIARRDRAASLAREAWFYDEMECIQGSVVPRCYGWFHIDLAAGERIPVLERFATDSDFTEDDAECLQDGHEFNAYKPLHPVLKELRESRTVLSMLVLEEVGLRLTIGRALSKSQREDIQDLYMQLGHLGIGVAGDIRWENLAWKHPSVPNKTSPLIKREHAFRLIDFDQAFKVDWSLNYFAFNNRPAVVGVLENVRYADCGPRWYPEDQLIEVKWREKAYANWCFSRDYPLST